MIFVWPGKILFLLNAELISEVAVGRFVYLFVQQTWHKHFNFAQNSAPPSRQMRNSSNWRKRLGSNLRSLSFLWVPVKLLLVIHVPDNIRPMVERLRSDGGTRPGHWWWWWCFKFRINYVTIVVPNVCLVSGVGPTPFLSPPLCPLSLPLSLFVSCMVIYVCLA